MPSNLRAPLTETTRGFFYLPHEREAVRQEKGAESSEAGDEPAPVRAEPKGFKAQLNKQAHRKSNVPNFCFLLFLLLFRESSGQA